ncbi:Endo-chitosanase [Mycena venus]|uniref:Endo-chitosanase n=1 Tax=Mycena venus TaxID=2733690 RepID=A0A8H6Y8V5_9AGAR|nr:Endo-chitosanase [Mycena venus]
MHTLLYALALASVALAAPLPSQNSTNPSADSNSANFAAAPDIDVARILTAVKGATKESTDRYPTSSAQDHWAEIYKDWSALEHVSVYHFIADMDIDCDGADANFVRGTGGDPNTGWDHHLDASKVPWYVIPEKFAYDKNHEGHYIKPNAPGAIICDGKMFYAIFGDSKYQKTEVIGEGSLLLGKTCFPKDGISGNNGHGPRDVACGSILPTHKQ